MAYHISLRTAAATLLIPAAVAAITPVSGEQRDPLFSADQEACFGRVYDRAHLASHPNQKVTSIHIFRSLSERSQSENWRPDQRAEAIKRFVEDGRSEVEAFVTFRDRPSNFFNSLTCNREDRRGVQCYIECDGGSFTLRRGSAATVILNNAGFVLIGGCGG